MAACALAFLAGFRLAPVFGEWYRGPALAALGYRLDWKKEATRFDPPLGAAPALRPLETPGGRKEALMREGAPTVAVFVRSCEACGVPDLLRDLDGLARDVPAARVAAVVMDVSTPLSPLPGPATRVLVLRDPTGAVARTLNAFVAGRAYAFDARGRLQYVSAVDAPWSATLRELAAWLAAASTPGRQ